MLQRCVFRRAVVAGVRRVRPVSSVAERYEARRARGDLQAHAAQQRAVAQFSALQSAFFAHVQAVAAYRRALREWIDERDRLLLRDASRSRVGPCRTDQQRAEVDVDPDRAHSAFSRAGLHERAAHDHAAGCRAMVARDRPCPHPSDRGRSRQADPPVPREQGCGMSGLVPSLHFDGMVRDRFGIR